MEDSLLSCLALSRFDPFVPTLHLRAPQTSRSFLPQRRLEADRGKGETEALCHWPEARGNTDREYAAAEAAVV